MRLYHTSDKEIRIIQQPPNNKSNTQQKEYRNGNTLMDKTTMEMRYS